MIFQVYTTTCHFKCWEEESKVGKNYTVYFQKKRSDYKEAHEINITRKIQKRTIKLLFSNHLENNKLIKISHVGLSRKLHMKQTEFASLTYN